MAELFIRTERVVPKNENEVSKPVPFSPFYVRELESFLADQAKEGFELKQISANNYSFTYEKSMPKELTYRLLLGPTQLDASLQGTLERAGWKLVTSMNKNWFEKDVVFHIFVSEDKNAMDDWFWRNNLSYAPIKTARSNFYLPILFEVAVILVAAYIMYSIPSFKKSSKDYFFLIGLLVSFLGDLFQRILNVQPQKAFLATLEPTNFLTRYQAVDWKIQKAKNNWYGLKSFSMMLVTFLISFMLKLFLEI